MNASMITTESSKQRPCRCKERAEAMKRASLALLNRDRESFQREMDFVRKTLTEDFGSDDAKSYLDGVRKWTRNLVKGF